MISPPQRPSQGGVDVYATSWCPFCHRLIASLTSMGIPFTVIDVEADQGAARFVEQVNGGNRVVPTVVFADGSTATNPDARLVADRVATAAS